MSVDRVRTYWRGVLIAAAVSLRQLGDATDGVFRESPPFVLIDERNDDDRFLPAERVGTSVLTVPLADEPTHFSSN